MILTVTLNPSVDKRYEVEALLPNTVMRVQSCRYTAGGKGLNVSKVARLLGEEVLATGFLCGHNGRYISEALESMDIRQDFVWTEGETRSCINVYDRQSKTQTEFLEPGGLVSAEALAEFLDKYSAHVGACSAVTISGSAPKGIPTDIYATLIRIAKEAGKPVILDTSGELLSMGIAAGPTLVKPNQDEIRAFTGICPQNEQDIAAGIRALRQQGAETVIVSMGKDGALAGGKDGYYRCMPPTVQTANTVGCGDSMVAAYAVGLSRGLSFPECLHLATAVSAAHAMSPLTGHFEQKDYEQIKDQARVVPYLPSAAR